jgi:hypothetical protein
VDASHPSVVDQKGKKFENNLAMLEFGCEVTAFRAAKDFR